MRVFDRYYFNIADRVKFADDKQYIENMLSELGLCYKRLAFGLEVMEFDEEKVKRAMERFPSLEKYFFDAKTGGCYTPGLTSLTSDVSGEKLFADPADIADIAALYSGIPQEFDIDDSYIMYEGIDWFGEGSRNERIALNYRRYRADEVFRTDMFYCDSITQFRNRMFGWNNCIAVDIDVTADDEPRSSAEIVKRLTPYLGDKTNYERLCLFSAEERAHNKERERVFRDRLKALGDSELPSAEDPTMKYSTGSASFISDMTDRAVLEEVFAGSGFVRDDSRSVLYFCFYKCTDEHGFTYEAAVTQSNTHSIFDVGISIESYNFNIGYTHADYEVKTRVEALVILRQAVSFFIKVREQLG
nr:hypothetical protein [Ruminococcus sp.]